MASHFPLAPLAEPHAVQTFNSPNLLQFNGCVWLASDQAFREHGAAVNLTNWSSINVQLFNFHAAGASVVGGQGSLTHDATDPSGSSTSQIICRSWNSGRCSQPSQKKKKFGKVVVQLARLGPCRNVVLPTYLRAKQSKQPEFCYKCQEDEETFDHVIFTDECSVHMEKQVKICFHRKWQPPKLKGRVKHLYKVHVKPGISKSKATKILMFDGNMDTSFLCQRDPK